MNPYEVLGVSENADEETIKKAYRELVKKYHPDRYVNNPLADLAAEKMKEVNKAYDMIMNKNKTTQDTRQSYGGYGGSYGTGANTYGTGGYGGQASFQTVRSLIAQSRIREAMAMLDELPRTAEWYYLSGRVRIQVGWYEQGISFLQQAVNMEPDNEEYRSALNNVRSRTGTYRTGNSDTVSTGCMTSELCTVCTLCSCARCCCI